MKNLKKILNPSDGEQIILTRDSTTNETIIIGGQVCNQYLDNVAFFTLMIYNSNTSDITYIYKDVEIEANDYLSISRFSLNQNQSLVVSVTLDNTEDTEIGINITFNYFDIIDYEYGFINVLSVAPLVFNQVPINPDLYDPMWKVKGTDDWLSITSVTSGSSGSNYIPIEANEYTIEFSDIDGYVTPDDIDIEIKAMKLTEISVTYQISDGVVKFKCDQIDLVSDFGWRVVGTSTYYNSNDYVIVDPGEVEIEFKEIDGFITPENFTFTCTGQKLHRFTISYERESGSLTVIMSPSSIRIGKSHKYNFQWYIVFPDSNNSSTKLYNSGEQISLIPTIDENQYKLVIDGMIFNERCFEVDENDILFTLSAFEEKIITVEISEVEC
jgi:hypothetical protein